MVTQRLDDKLEELVSYLRALVCGKIHNLLLRLGRGGMITIHQIPVVLDKVASHTLESFFVDLPESVEASGGQVAPTRQVPLDVGDRIFDRATLPLHPCRPHALVAGHARQDRHSLRVALQEHIQRVLRHGRPIDGQRTALQEGSRCEIRPTQPSRRNLPCAFERHLAQGLETELPRKGLRDAAVVLRLRSQRPLGATAHADRLVKQTGRLRHGQELAANVPTRRLPDDCDIVRIAPELVDLGTHPSQG
mmetsp:Transcript_108996/g.314829  ORF Transcript_108996/g.314829 Transcript_108996/m.314829 type:complete len:249 (-) Transcript_108996:665-1411(-)